VTTLDGFHPVTEVTADERGGLQAARLARARSKPRAEYADSTQTEWLMRTFVE